MAIRGILFDKDGTLLDFHATWGPINRIVALTLARGDERLAERLLQAGGVDPASERTRAGSALAQGNTIEIASLWAPALPERALGELVEEIDRLYVEGAAGAVALGELRPLLERLSARGMKLGLATSDSARGAAASLKALGVLDLFDFVAGYDSGHGVKPSPGMALAFCAATGLQPKEIAVVGDSRHDLEMGRAAGAGLVLGVLSGTGTADDLGARADRLLADIGELEALLDLEAANS
ncbi:MAG: HAD family hydrolase [Kiloniellales bacterium]